MKRKRRQSAPAPTPKSKITSKSTVASVSKSKPKSKSKYRISASASASASALTAARIQTRHSISKSSSTTTRTTARSSTASSSSSRTTRAQAEKSNSPHISNNKKRPSSLSKTLSASKAVRNKTSIPNKTTRRTGTTKTNTNTSASASTSAIAIASKNTNSNSNSSTSGTTHKSDTKNTTNAQVTCTFTTKTKTSKSTRSTSSSSLLETSQQFQFQSQSQSIIPRPPLASERFTRKTFLQFHKVLSKHSNRPPPTTFVVSTPTSISASSPFVSLFSSPSPSPSPTKSPLSLSSPLKSRLRSSSVSPKKNMNMISSSSSQSKQQSNHERMKVQPQSQVPPQSQIQPLKVQPQPQPQPQQLPSFKFRPSPSLSLSSSSSLTFSFEEIYEAPASLGKQLEIRWFHSDLIPFHRDDGGNDDDDDDDDDDDSGNSSDDNNDNDVKRSDHPNKDICREGKRYRHGHREESGGVMKQHTMPFLRRSLSYIKLCNVLSKKRNRCNNNDGIGIGTGTGTGIGNSSISSNKKRKLMQTSIPIMSKSSSTSESIPIVASTSTSTSLKKKSNKKNDIHPIHKLLQLSSKDFKQQLQQQHKQKYNTNNTTTYANMNNPTSSSNVHKKRRKKHDKENNNKFGLDLLQSIFHYRVQQFNPRLSFYATDRATRRSSNIKKNKQDRDEEGDDEQNTTNNNKTKTKQSSLESLSLEITAKAASKQKMKMKQTLKNNVFKASIYGKTFPPYRPYENKKWNVPILNKNAFELYCQRQMGKEMTARFLDYMKKNKDTLKLNQGSHDSFGVASAGGTGAGISMNVDGIMTVMSNSNNERQERLLFKKIKKSWEKLSASSEKLYWVQEEAWDKERYSHEKYIYDTAKEQGVDAIVDCSNEVKHKFDRDNDDLVDFNDRLNNQFNVGNVFYYFVYYNGNEMCIQKELRNDRRCPFCSFHAGSNKGILIHCKTTHGDSLVFDGGVDEENNFHVIIRSIRCSNEEQNVTPYLTVKEEKKGKWKEFLFVSPKLANGKVCSTLTNENISIAFIPKSQELTKHLEPAARKRKIRSLEQQRGFVHPKAKSQYIVSENEGPLRQYYHSRTNLPFSKSDWDNDGDSDDEEDDHWIRELGESLMDELGDVSLKEKMFMNLWNKFIKSCIVIADRTISKKCRDFILAHHDELVQHDLRKHLLLHLFNLWDNRIVSSWAISALMQLFDGMRMNKNVYSAEGCKPNT